MFKDLEAKELSAAVRPDTRRLSRRRFTRGAAAVSATVAMVAIGRTTLSYPASPVDFKGRPSVSPNASPIASPSAETQVTIADLSFTPAVLHIMVGSPITWINLDSVPHTVTGDDQTEFASPRLRENDHFDYRFTEPGTYTYHCEVHPFMTAQVIVS
jgi:plastocyanin